ncbi:hypothetical protein LTR85_009448 [Meristemomyces frigidus]|nr:hypothetical protein LTR85_009448 [Meristemomyces frigidus]
MRLSAVSCLLAALYSASFVLADAIPKPAAAATADGRPALDIADEEQPKLEIRQGGAADVAATASAAAVQFPSITTQWVETTIGAATTWVEVIYTQTFASVPDQWTTAGAGSIGYGTLKSKRDIQARETGYAQPVVLAIQQEIVTHYIRPVTEVLIIETFTILPNMTYNGTHGSSNMTYNATLINGTFGNATASRRNFTLPASLDTVAHRLPTGTAGTAA